ncbi:Sulfate adenylyltransferase, partial [Coemansia sp. RSA 2052]
MANSPHGGVLKDLYIRDEPIQAALQAEAETLPHVVLTERQLCDLELILNGGFSPLEGFHTQEEYTSVVHGSRLPCGTLWTIPIYLDIASSVLSQLNITVGSRLTLRDPRDDQPLAILSVSSLYQADIAQEATLVYGADDEAHPAVHYLRHSTRDTYVGGSVQAVNAPQHYDY